MVARTDKEWPNERILVQVKSNLSPTGTAIVFSFSENGIEWVEETSKTADEVLGNAFSSMDRPDEQIQKAKDVLSRLLSDHKPKPQNLLMEQFKTMGICESTVKKAKAQLNIRSIKQGTYWYWLLE